MSQLNKKLPDGGAKQGKIAVNIVGIGGGSVEFKDAVSQDGNLRVGEYHATIQTPGGSATADYTDVYFGQQFHPAPGIRVK